MADGSIEHLLSRLQGLTSISAPSGYEDAIIRHILDQLPEGIQSKTVDNLGNVIVQVNKIDDPDPYKVLVFAHMDELGFIIKKIENDGFARVERLGGIPEKSMMGQTVMVTTPQGTLQGVIGTKSHHVTPIDEKFKAVPISEAYIDFGFRSKQEAVEAGVDIGLPVTYARQFFNRGSIAFSNAVDNRAGCLVLLEVIDRLLQETLPCEVYIVFSVQEEFNLQGVLPAVRAVNPDVAITIDLVVSSDTPDLRGVTDIKLGAGPCLNMYSFHARGTLAGLIPNPKLVRLVKDTASNHQITMQLSTFMGGLTDASFSQLQNGGIPMVDLAYPTRYTHAPVEAVDLMDLIQLVELLVKLMPSFHRKADFRRG